MNNDSVSIIKDKIPIEDLVGDYIPLEKAGSNLKGCCPFHNEKSPSFFVSPDRNAYYCFGCGAKGDIFTFVQEFEGVDFKTALKTLAEKAGVTLDSFNKGDSKTDEYYRILESATKFYEAHLVNKKDLLKYLKDRGLNEKSIEEWRIGYVSADWRKVYDFLISKKVDVSMIEKVGLIKKGDKGSYYDRFRNRIMFPLFDSQSRVVGFSGRTLSQDTDEAKYINSPDSPLFNKSELLYGFNFAKNIIRKVDFSIIVEGQFDVILSHQAGYKNAVATSGTSLTEEHVNQLQRLSKKIVIALDGDGAGLRASERAWKIALSKSMDVKVALLPDGKDPADLIKENPEDWKRVIKEAKHIVDFLISVFEKKTFGDDRERIREIKLNILPYIHSIESAMEQAHFVERLSSRFSIPTESIWDDLKEMKGEKNTIKKEEEFPVEDSNSKNNKGTTLERLFGIMFWNDSKGEADPDLSKFIKDNIQSLIDISRYETLLEYYGKQKDSLILEAEILYNKTDEKTLKEISEEMFFSIKKNVLLKKRLQLQKDLELAEKETDKDKEAKIMNSIQEISRKISGL